jgi:hypothetical protein
VLAARRPASITIELAVGIQIVGFQIAVYTFAAGACGSTAWGGLDHHERGLILLRNLCRRQPSLLQRGVLAEQRFLQRPSHTLSLQPVKFLAPSAQHSLAAVYAAGTARPNLLFLPPRKLAALQRYSITRIQAIRRDG